MAVKRFTEEEMELLRKNPLGIRLSNRASQIIFHH